MEHIFDIKQVLSNYMALPKIGGDVHICTNANNLCGHGFYQFSPEFFYRVFSEANGFRIEQVCMIETPFHLVEKSPRQRVFEAADPMSVGKRMVVVTDKPVSIYVHARRIADRPLFADPPYQSDYRIEWTAHYRKDAFPSPPQTGVGRAASGYAFSYLSEMAGSPPSALAAPQEFAAQPKVVQASDALTTTTRGPAASRAPQPHSLLQAVEIAQQVGPLGRIQARIPTP